MNKESKAYLSGEFEAFFKESELNSMVAEDAVAYSQSVQKYYDTLAAVNYASRDSYNKGKEAGIEKGIEKASLDIAMKLRQSGMSEEFIRSTTGISFSDMDRIGYGSSHEA